MSEKIVFKNLCTKVKSIKLNDVLESVTKSINEEDNQRKQLEIEMHNYFIKGFNEGQKEALNRLQKEYSDKLKEAYLILDSIASKIDNQIKEQVQKINEFVLQLSFQIAEKIIRREIDKDSPILKVVDESLKKLTSANEATIKLNPNDFSLVESHLSLINKKLSSGNIRLEADERIEKGGCFIETEIGNADGRVTTQIENIKRQIEMYFEENNA